jgi:hypothetical protein
MMGELGDELDVRDRFVQDDAIDSAHVLGDEIKDRRKAVRGLTPIFKWNNDTQRSFLGVQFPDYL